MDTPPIPATVFRSVEGYCSQKSLARSTSALKMNVTYISFLMKNIFTEPRLVPQYF